MIFDCGAARRTLFLAAFVAAATALPSLASAQAAPTERGRAAMADALSAANLRPDQQAHIGQLMHDAKARIKNETDKGAKKADKRQLRSDILATMDPGQRAAFEGRLRQLKAARRSARQAGAETQGPPPQQQPQSQQAPY